MKLHLGLTIIAISTLANGMPMAVPKPGWLFPSTMDTVSTPAQPVPTVVASPPYARVMYLDMVRRIKLSAAQISEMCFEDPDPELCQKLWARSRG